jgi:Fe-S-cluster containining protein
MGLWYERGLRFECTQCGKCCTGPPPPDGPVYVTDAEIKRIAQFLRSNPREILQRCTKKIGRRRSLINAGLSDRCIFLGPDNRCNIHDAKPAQCRTFPFWKSNVAHPEAWVETARSCEGIGQGELIPVEEITRRIKKAASL